jgi:hypothetical protein
MAVPRRSGIRTGRYESRNTYGKQIKDRRREATSEVFHTQSAAVHAVRSASGRLPEVRHLPHLFSEACGPGLHSRCPEGQLVGRETDRHDSIYEQDQVPAFRFQDFKRGFR